MDRSVTFSKFCAAIVVLVIGSARADITNLTPGVNAGPFVLSPDAGRIVFEVYEAPGGRLYSAPINAATAPAPLSLPSADNGSAFLVNSQISRDSSMIVYNRNEFPDTGWHVATYASRLDGTTPPVLLNRSKVYDDDSSQYSIAISADGHYGAVRADQGDRVFDVISGPTNGSAPAVMLNPGPHSEDLYSSANYGLLSSGNRAIYHLPGGEDPGVFSRPFDASEPALRLSPEGADILWYAFSVSRDQSKLLMPTYSPSGRREVYVASPQTGQRTLLFSQEDTNQFGFVRLSNDGNRAIFSLGSRQYSAPTDGSAPAQEFGPYPSGLNSQEVSPDSRLIAYMTSPENHSPTELYVSPIDGSGIPKKLVGGLPEGMNFMQIAPDGNHIFFFDSLGRFPNFMSVATDGSGPPVQLAKTGGFAFTPDGSGLIVGVNPDLDYDMDSFYFVPLDGGPAVFLADSPYAGGGISQFLVTPDGSKVIFLADDGAEHSGIFSLTVPEPTAMLTAAGALLMLTVRRRSRVSLQ